MYNVNWGLLIQRMLPVLKRKPIMFNWLRAVIAPLVQLYNNGFLVYREAVRYKLSFTSQIIYLEKLLNDQFNNGLPAYTGGSPSGIYISDPTTNLIPVYLYNNIEQRPAAILYNESEGQPPVYFRNSIEYAGNYEFIVNVPDALFDVATNPVKVAEMKAWIDFYRVAGKRYNIVNYTP